MAAINISSTILDLKCLFLFCSSRSSAWGTQLVGVAAGELSFQRRDDNRLEASVAMSQLPGKTVEMRYDRPYLFK
jgi:hypothetical protein